MSAQMASPRFRAMEMGQILLPWPADYPPGCRALPMPMLWGCSLLFDLFFFLIFFSPPVFSD